MTAEDEEFNRIEMESRIKQEYVRAMRTKVGDDFDAEYAKTMTGLMDELAVARVLVRELGDRLAKLEKTEQEPVVCCQQYDTCLQPCTPRGKHLARRTWVGLTPDDFRQLEKETTVNGYNGDYCPTWDLIEAVEEKLKEKNT